MQGKILIVDAISTNRIVLKVKLASAFYDVAQAACLNEALHSIAATSPDLVICAMSLPGGGAAELCAAIQMRDDISCISVLALGEPCDAPLRLSTLAQGAQDAILKPVDDILLLSRVRSIIRGANASAEWQMREDTSRALGFAEDIERFAPKGQITLVSTRPGRTKDWAIRLRNEIPGDICSTTPDAALRDLKPGSATQVFGLFLDPDEQRSQGVLRLLSALRANGSTCHAGVLVIQNGASPELAAQALDLGADDLMIDGFEQAEFCLRLGGLVRRKNVADVLRATVRTGLQAAVLDPLTGLHNRRYALSRLSTIADNAALSRRSFAVMIADMDYFKSVNDVHGHAAGDAVLVETARRLREALPQGTLVARMGGEEFLIAMPATSEERARQTAKHLCRSIGDLGYKLPGGLQDIRVTVSIGLAMGAQYRDYEDAVLPCPVGALLEEADRALYSAKMRGRNQVTSSRPAA